MSTPKQLHCHAVKLQSGNDGVPTHVDWCSNDSFLLGYSKGVVSQYAIESDLRQIPLRVAFNGKAVTDIVCSPAQPQVAVCVVDGGEVHIIDCRTGTSQAVPLSLDTPDETFSASLDLTGSFLAVGDGPSVKIFDVRTFPLSSAATPVRNMMDVHSDTIISTRWLPEPTAPNVVVTAGVDALITVSDVTAEEEDSQLAVVSCAQPLCGMAFFAAGDTVSRVVAYDRTQSATVYDMAVDRVVGRVARPLVAAATAGPAAHDEAWSACDAPALAPVALAPSATAAARATGGVLFASAGRGDDAGAFALHSVPFPPSAGPSAEVPVYVHSLSAPAAVAGAYRANGNDGGHVDEVTGMAVTGSGPASVVVTFGDDRRVCLWKPTESTTPVYVQSGSRWQGRGGPGGGRRGPQAQGGSMDYRSRGRGGRW